jgi:integrase/recombinase XerD
VGWFLRFAAERAVGHVGAVTRGLIERYQKHLYALRVRVGAPRLHGAEAPQALRPLSICGQHARLWAVVRFFRWCERAGHIAHSPAAMIDLPRLPKPLPKPALTVAEVERILAMPDVTTPHGLRDRAMLEVLYATGIRRGELCRLAPEDIDHTRAVVRILQGKGRKGRIVPISARALAWVARYAAEVWTRFPQGAEQRRLFLSVDNAQRRRDRGRPLSANAATSIMRRHLITAGIEKDGACHIFRHTAATLMMENGADIRAIQDFLGHADLKTTGIYTNVSFKFLKEQHAKTHPSAMAAAPQAMPATDAPPSCG